MEEQKISENKALETTLNTQVEKGDEVVKIEILLPTNAYFMSGIRDFTLTLIKNTTEFGEKWAYRMQSVVDELCNNAIEHGSEPGKDVKIIFKVIGKKEIVVLVEDSGTGPSKMKAEEIEKLVAERRESTEPQVSIRGRGLAKIVHEWTDELKFEDMEEGGIRVIAKKFLDDPKLKTDDAITEVSQNNRIILS